MKKLLTITALLCLIGGTATQAEEHNVGDIIGEVYPTGIVTDVCGYKIPAYNIGGETAVRVADLSQYGFDVRFEDGIAYADYNWEKEKAPIDTAAKSNINVLYTDIVVMLNGIEIPSFNIDGSMAIPIERTCEIYLETNKENEISPFSLNYIWNAADKALSLDISDDRVSYQDFMIDLIKAAHMDFDSAFYNHYVQTKDGYPNEKYTEKFSDIKGTKLEEYVYLLMKADLLQYYLYEDGDKLYPYRGVTNTDAAFLISRMIGSGIEAENELFYLDDKEVVEYNFSHYFPKSDFMYDQYLVNYDLSANSARDMYLVADWAKPYFAFANGIGIIKTDENRYLLPNRFLTKELEKQYITKMCEYMEQGISDIDLNITEESNKEIHHLESPAQIIDGVLYVPIGSMFNSSFKQASDTVKVKISKTGMSYTYNVGFGLYYHIMPGIDGYVKEIFRQASGGQDIPFPKPTPYKVRKLYGEPMVAVYDYENKNVISTLDVVKFDEETNTLYLKYSKSFFNGS